MFQLLQWLFARLRYDLPARSYLQLISKLHHLSCRILLRHLYFIVSLMFAASKLH
jgi:hypothetical protein